MMRRFYGIPHPGTFVLDRSGRVTARFFEEAVQERSTASSIAVRLGETIPGAPDRAASRVATDHLEAVAWATDDIVAPGNRLVLRGRRGSQARHARLRSSSGARSCIVIAP